MWDNILIGLLIAALWAYYWFDPASRVTAWIDQEIAAKKARDAARAQDNS